MDVDIHPCSGMEKIGQDCPDDEGKCRDNLKIENRLQPDTAYLLEVPRPANSCNDHAEDQRSNDHLDQFDKAVTKRLQALSEIWCCHTNRHAENQSDHHPS